LSSSFLPRHTAVTRTPSARITPRVALITSSTSAVLPSKCTMSTFWPSRVALLTPERPRTFSSATVPLAICTRNSAL
jgi:hypothetical protein